MRTRKDLVSGLQRLDLFAYSPNYNYPSFKSAFGLICTLAVVVIFFTFVVFTSRRFGLTEKIPLREEKPLKEEDVEVPHFGVAFRDADGTPFFNETYFSFMFYQVERRRDEASTFTELPREICTVQGCPDGDVSWSPSTGVMRGQPGASSPSYRCDRRLGRTHTFVTGAPYESVDVVAVPCSMGVGCEDPVAVNAMIERGTFFLFFEENRQTRFRVTVGATLHAQVLFVIQRRAEIGRYLGLRGSREATIQYARTLTHLLPEKDVHEEYGNATDVFASWRLSLDHRDIHVTEKPPLTFLELVATWGALYVFLPLTIGGVALLYNTWKFRQHMEENRIQDIRKLDADYFSATGRLLSREKYKALQEKKRAQRDDVITQVEELDEIAMVLGSGETSTSEPCLISPDGHFISTSFKKAVQAEYDNQKRLLDMQLFLLAMVGILLMVIELSLAWDSDRQTLVATDTTEFLKILMLFSTVILLVRLYHYYLYMVNVERKKLLFVGHVPFWKSHKVYPFLVEFCICAIQPLPFLSRVTSAFIFDDKLGVFMFLRLYLFVRLVKDFSTLFRYRREITETYETTRAVKFNWWLIIKYYFYDKSVALLAFIALILLVIISFSTYVTERERQDEFSYRNALWFTWVSIMTVGYGDFAPEGAWGQIMAMISVVFGVMLTSLMITVITQHLALQADEKHAAVAAVDFELGEKLRATSAKIIQLSWRRYSYLNRGRGLIEEKECERTERLFKVRLHLLFQKVKAIRGKLARFVKKQTGDTTSFRFRELQEGVSNMEARVAALLQSHDILLGS